MRKVLVAFLAFSLLAPVAVFGAAKPAHAHHKAGSKGKKHKRSKGKKAGYAKSKHKAYARRSTSSK
jgi:hypothetical protein